MASMPRTLTIRNGEKRERAFSDEEMEGRLARLRGIMAGMELDLCLFTSYHGVNYFNDFVYCSFGRSYGLVVDHETATAITANIDFGWPHRRGFAQTLAYTDWQKDNFFEAVRQLAGKARRIGVEFDHLSVEANKKLQAALPGVELIDVAPSAMGLRMIKSKQEIDLIEHGARVADIGGAACVASLEEGVPEHVVAGEATRAMVEEIARSFPHLELMDTWTWFQSGIMTDGAHNPVTSRRVQKGDILSLNCFPMIAGYYTALERTLFFDHVDEASLRHWRVNVEVHERGLELIRPGAVCSEIAKSLNEIYKAHGLLERRTFGYGHSFGTLCHYYGREAGLELREDVETVLEPGMVVSMEPMITIPEGLPGAGGYREHDILVVEEHAARNITGFPYGPDHNIIRA